jgi:hypothetical protein
MECCFTEHPTKNAAFDACKATILKALLKQLENQSEAARLIDAIPTIGKTTAAAEIASEHLESFGNTKLTFLTHRRKNRDQFDEMVHRHSNAVSTPTIAHLPVLDLHCPTANGEHGDAAQQRIRQHRGRGVSPGAIHAYESETLPCGGMDCQYMEMWRGYDTRDILIGHPSHAFIDEVVDDRIVIIDEDPGPAFRTEFEADELYRVAQAFLQTHGDFPASDLDTLKAFRGNDGLQAQREDILKAIRSLDMDETNQTILDTERGHVDAKYAIWALLEDPVETEDGACDSYRINLGNGIEHASLSDTAVAAYNRGTGALYVRRPPDFGTSAALVCLDGTPTEPIWAGRLGVSDLETVRVLCDDCRVTYLRDVLGYQIVQTSPYTKPYSSGRYVNYDKARGLLHEVSRRTEQDIGLITTNSVEEEVRTYDDRNQVDINSTNCSHYGEIKGSNEFAGEDIQVGVILGSPHPGDDEVKLLAGLDGTAYSTELVEDKEGGHEYKRSTTNSEGEPYLRNFRENRVAQAVLRFGRIDGAVVFVHTSAIPEWMGQVAVDGQVERHSEGLRAVIKALQELGTTTTAEVNERADSIKRTMVYHHLKMLSEEGWIEKRGTSHRIRWDASELPDLSPTASLSVSTALDFPE